MKPDPGEVRAQVPDSLLVRAGVLVALGMALAGLIAVVLIQKHDLEKIVHNVAFVLYMLNEPVVLALSTIGLAALWLLLVKRPPHADLAWRWPAFLSAPVVTLIVLVVTSAGVFLVMHDFPLSMDEYLSLWQAEALTNGTVSGRIPVEWQPFVAAVTPDYVRPAPDGTWTSQFLPVHAALLAAASPLHAQWLVSPLLSGIAILAAAGVAKRVLPEEPMAPVAAAVLLATSSQFLVTGMTYYSWQAHLAFNMVWLWLFLSPRQGIFVLAPMLGILAMGLHRPHVHALFAAPFLARLVFQRQWMRAVIAAGIYLLGIAFWYSWMMDIQPNSANTARSIGVPNLISVTSRLMNLGHFVGWQNIAAVVLSMVAVLQWKRLPVPARDLAWGIALTFCFYIFYTGSGGHGWGARYMHSVLGNFALLGAIGLMCVPEMLRGQAKAVLVAGTAFALLLLPLRLVQTEAIVGPFARASRAVEAMDADIVIVDGVSGWYLQDLVRNDPFVSNRPVIMRPTSELASSPLPPGMEDVRVVDQPLLAKYGIRPRAAPR